MRLKENLNIRKVGNDYFLASESDNGIDYTRVISLNNSAFYLLTEVQEKDFTKDDWVRLLMKKYDVTLESAHADVDKLIHTLTSAGVII